MRHFIVLA